MAVWSVAVGVLLGLAVVVVRAAVLLNWEVIVLVCEFVVGFFVPGGGIPVPVA